MYTCLLKRILPFTLTFILGATLGGFVKLFGRGEPGMKRSFVFSREYSSGHGCDYRRRKLLAESKPLVILFKPDARWPRGLETGKEGVRPMWVSVTFGADGKVHEVETDMDSPLASSGIEGDAVRSAIERAARQIQFVPETINGIPVSVTKEVEIRFLSD
jgi:hypothetical protein